MAMVNDELSYERAIMMMTENNNNNNNYYMLTNIVIGYMTIKTST